MPAGSGPRLQLAPAETQPCSTTRCSAGPTASSGSSAEGAAACPILAFSCCCHRRCNGQCCGKACGDSVCCTDNAARADVVPVSVGKVSAMQDTIFQYIRVQNWDAGS